MTWFNFLHKNIEICALLHLLKVRRYLQGILTIRHKKFPTGILALPFFIILKELLGEEESLLPFHQNIPGQYFLKLTIFLVI